MNTLKETSIRPQIAPISADSEPETNLRESLKSADTRLSKPRKTVVPLAIGLAWGENPDYIYQEKLDGRFSQFEVGSSVLAGELMPSGQFIAFDCLQHQVEDLRRQPLSERLHVLNSILTTNSYLLSTGIRRFQSARDGGKFLSEILARGGEGVVRKHLASPWGATMEACKRLETFTCIVTGINEGQSVQIARIVESENVLSVESEIQNVPAVSAAFQLSTINSNTLSTAPAGSVALLSGKADRVRIGSIIKVEGFGLTREGKIREPRPCKDTPTSWLIQY